MAENLSTHYLAFQKSQQVLNEMNITFFPFSLIDVVKERHNILIQKLIEYEEFNKESNLKINDARCFYYPKKNIYLIVYNQSKPINRIRFSIAHELGHIFLNHLSDEITDLSRGGLINNDYQLMEEQANVFAGTFLAPPILIQEYLIAHKIYIQNINKDHLARFFGISPPAAYYRINDFKIWETMNPSKNEIDLLNRCKITIYPNHCKHCSKLFFIPNAKYCINCSSTKLLKYKEYNMKYSSLELNEYGKTNVCPICDNENTNIKGDYCQICGTHIANHCTNEFCGNNFLSPDSRFCPFCGHETTFSKDNLLEPWEKVKKAIDDLDDFPF